MEHLHCAYNLTTGEIITTNNGNFLKRRVHFVNTVSRELGYPVGQWIFGHKGLDNICDRARAKSGMERIDLV